MAESEPEELRLKRLDEPCPKCGEQAYGDGKIIVCLSCRHIEVITTDFDMVPTWLQEYEKEQGYE